MYWTQWTGNYNGDGIESLLFSVAWVIILPGLLLTLLASTVADPVCSTPDRAGLTRADPPAGLPMVTRPEFRRGSVTCTSSGPGTGFRSATLVDVGLCALGASHSTYRLRSGLPSRRR